MTLAYPFGEWVYGKQFACYRFAIALNDFVMWVRDFPSAASMLRIPSYQQRLSFDESIFKKWLIKPQSDNRSAISVENHFE
jgi:hypothetical protein